MKEMSLEGGLILSAVLFLIGLAGVLIRRNMIFILISLEIMLNAAGIAFVFSGSYWGIAEGQIMFIFILAIAASEVTVGLALILLVYKKYKSLDTRFLKNLEE